MESEAEVVDGMDAMLQFLNDPAFYQKCPNKTGLLQGWVSWDSGTPNPLEKYSNMLYASLFKFKETKIEFEHDPWSVRNLKRTTAHTSESACKKLREFRSKINEKATFEQLKTIFNTVTTAFSVTSDYQSKCEIALTGLEMLVVMINNMKNKKSDKDLDAIIDWLLRIKRATSLVTYSGFTGVFLSNSQPFIAFYL